MTGDRTRFEQANEPAGQVREPVRTKWSHHWVSQMRTVFEVPLTGVLRRSPQEVSRIWNRLAATTEMPDFPMEGNRT